MFNWLYPVLFLFWDTHVYKDQNCFFHALFVSFVSKNFNAQTVYTFLQNSNHNIILLLRDFGMLCTLCISLHLDLWEKKCIFLFLKSRVTHRCQGKKQRRRRRRNLPSANVMPKLGAWTLQLNLRHRGQGSKYLNHHLKLPRMRQREAGS